MTDTQLLVDTGWSAQTRAEVAARLTHPGLGRWLDQVQQVRSCSHPVRLVGTTDTIDTATGEVLSSYSSTAEPDGVTYVRCGNRRASVCPSCSHEYKGDVWHVLMAGAAGGMKDVPDTVAAHPLVFATLTAPSFGLVHATKKPGRPGSRRVSPAKVAEFQRRGVIHFHALIRLDGSPTEDDGYPAPTVDVTTPRLWRAWWRLPRLGCGSTPHPSTGTTGCASCGSAPNWTPVP